MQWRLLDMRDETGATEELISMFACFEPALAEREADVWMVKWLQEQACDSAFSGELNIWLLTDGKTIAAYHTEQPGACTLLRGRRVSSLHMAMAARNRAHSGSGEKIVKHLLALAREHDREYVTLDPFDAATAAVWARHGFHDTLTRIHDDPEADCFRVVREVSESS